MNIVFKEPLSLRTRLFCAVLRINIYLYRYLNGVAYVLANETCGKTSEFTRYNINVILIIIKGVFYSFCNSPLVSNS